MATQIILTSGSSWTVPSDWNSANNTVECIGGGQGGSVSTTSALGGAYAKVSNLALTAGAGISIHIGAGGSGSTTATKNNGGDTWLNSTATVLAPGGGSGTTAAGSTVHTGGGGSSARGGGGAGGPAGNGSNPSSVTGGAGGSGSGGAGGAGGSTVSPGSAGTEWGTAGSGGGGGGSTTTGATAAAGGNYGGAGGCAATTGTGGAGAPGVIVLTYTPATAGSETFQVNETLAAATLAATLTDGHGFTLAQTLAAATLESTLSRTNRFAAAQTLAPATLYAVMQAASAPPPPSFLSGVAGASAAEIYNRATSRIGIDQFLGDPNETSKAGSLYRMWYDACRQTCLRDFPWNFATTIQALAPLSNVTVPGWGYAYAYPIDCLQARQVCNADGARTTLAGVLYGDTFDYPWSTAYQGGYPAIGVPKMPFKVLSVGTPSGGVQRVIVTDMPNAFLVYTINVTDTGQFDAGFIDALEWLIASEIAGPFIGAPAGQQVAEACGKYYRNAVLNARAQNLNEATPDTRPDSPAISARL